ncbi:MAG: Fic family protein [Bacteroidales bacterium]
MVEQLGSGVPRILRSYPKNCFKFTDHFLRMSFPKTLSEEVTTQVTTQETIQVTPQVTPQVKALMEVIEGEMTRTEIQEKLGLKDRMNFTHNYLQPALRLGLIEMTIPDKPNSRLQRYRVKG